MPFTVISMFSGAGGLDMGFHNQGFKILWANDSAKDACDTYDLWANYNPDGTRKRKEDCTVIECGDISDIELEKVFPGVEIDVVVGGFPCQGFSLAGPRQVDDSRNVLYRHFIEMVRVKKPKVIVAENVLGIKTLGNGVVFEKIIEDFSDLGYTMSAPTVNAKDFGVPQDRMRVIFIGIRNDICDGGAYIFPFGDTEVVTMRDVLKDLPPVDMNDVCQAPFSSRYMSRNRKRKYTDVSFTIPAMAKQVPLSPDSGGMRYIDVDQFEFVGTNRRLSYKEAAAIQTFPRDMVFCGDLDSKYKQIGNAVPVKLAERIAGEVKNILTRGNRDLRLNRIKPEEEIKADRRITKNVINGKAFEYTSLMALRKELLDFGWSEEQLEINEDNNYQNIQKAYRHFEISKENADDESEDENANIREQGGRFWIAARAAARYLYSVEPILQQPDGDLYCVFSAMPDTAGAMGDVRDIVLCIYSEKDRGKAVREIGISCKNNHEAVKHPRIRGDLDFAKDWTGGKFSCTREFMDSMKLMQDKIEDCGRKYSRWSLVEGKHDEIFYPIVKLFAEEIKRLGMADKNAADTQKARAREFAQLFFEYMFGNQDFYKFIKDDKSKATKVYPYNMHGSLMKPYNGRKNQRTPKSIFMPEEIVEVRVKPGSKTTLEVYFDQWIISMRLHSADSKITKTSLKFDVQIKAQPRKIMGENLPWDVD